MNNTNSCSELWTEIGWFMKIWSMVLPKRNKQLSWWWSN